MTRGSNDAVGRIRALRHYFERHAEGEPLFAPEAEVARRVLSMIEADDLSAPADVLQLLKSIDEVPHYNGSGWIDFTMAVHAWVRSTRDG